VFLSPIRSDLVNFVHTNMAKNHRQAYAVSDLAGHQTAAISWGTGRAVSRIPRVPGSGTSRSGQGAFGNMCRKGRMFAPTRQWRKWHRKINKNQKRYAVTSALAASALPSLVLARGHRVEQIAEVPLVVADSAINGISRTKDAVKLLKALNAYADVEKVSDSKRVTTGRGKSRNRRYTQRRGPLIVHSGVAPLLKGFRNLPGVEFSDVSRLNLLTLAPGGHLGRFIIWTESAFKQLEKIYGNGQSATSKKGFSLPRPILANADISRTINSDEVQSRLFAAHERKHRVSRHVNPLGKFERLAALNPYVVTERRKRLRAEVTRKDPKALLPKKLKKQDVKKVKAKKAAEPKKGAAPIVKSRYSKYGQLLRKI
jgi:large subunit ribosomal protein L4e